MSRLSQVLNAFGFEKELCSEIESAGRMLKLSSGKILPSTSEMPIVLNGLLKVIRKEGENEVYLYFLESGETCAMSISCCLEGNNGGISVTAEEDSELWMVPMALLDSWVTKFPSFRKFVFRTYQNRFDELLTTLDSVVFTKMDERIYKYLLDNQEASGNFVINKTHAQIAQDLNTSRVVVSRLLKQLEKEDKIEQFRNRIEML